MTLKKKRLLIISNGYPSKDGIYSDCIFVKDQVDLLKNYFKEINVVVSKPFVPFFYNFFSKNKVIHFKDYSYDNVNVYYPRYFFLPCKICIGISSFLSVFLKILFFNIKFDLIHAHFTYKSGFIGCLLKFIFKKKLYLTVHENKNSYLEEINSKSILFSFVWKNCDNIIRVNNLDMHYLKKYNSNICCIPNGFNNDLFYKKNKLESKIKLNLPTDKKIILHVGSYLISHKNQINILYAVNLLKKIRCDFVVYLIGRGKDESIIKSKIKSLNLESEVKVIGSKSHYEIAYWMASSDIFILPSYSESFGVVNIEAMSQGVPVISTINGGSESIIKSTKIGFLYKNPDDYKMLCDLINKSLNKDWDNNYIYNYSKRYTWKKIVTKLVELYES